MIDFSLMIDYLRGRSSKGYELFGAHFVWGKQPIAGALCRLTLHRQRRFR